ncbi:MAG: hypothetical protein L0H31_17245, partial [Nocardioidaceae bacterium]|nr:hypothetical protein [Nocardioidaceae bacterium]
MVDFAKVVRADPCEDLAQLGRFWELFTGGDIRLAPQLLRAPAGTQAHADHVARKELLDES